MTVRVFYSYSHKDAELRRQLSTFLAPLRRQKKIDEWHDRDIEPGADWNKAIHTQIESADLILLLISSDFLASEYCFGVEVEKAFARLKRGEARVVPVLLRPCLWKESRFSELQIIPRDAKPVTSWASLDEALNAVAMEIQTLVSEPVPAPVAIAAESREGQRFESSLEVVVQQVHSYARQYEKIRQRMRASHERTLLMQRVFDKMRALATASYPLLDALASSPLPGDRLAAVAILQVFAAERFLPFLVRLVGSEKPFVGLSAIKALRFAVGAADSSWHARLASAITEADLALDSVGAGPGTARQKELRAASDELQALVNAFVAPPAAHD